MSNQNNYGYYGINEKTEHPAELLKTFTRLNYSCICWILDECNRLNVSGEFMWGICKSGYLYYSTVDQTTPPEYNIDDYILEVIVDCERRIVKKMCVFRIVTPEKKITWVAYGPDTENLSIYSRKPKNL